MTKISKSHHRTKTGLIKRNPKKKYWTGNIEKIAENNKNFRKVIFTGKNEQLVVMSIPVGDDVGDEVHNNIDQFFRIEEGTAKLFVKGKTKTFNPGGAFVIGRGTTHNIKNVGKVPLKLYTIYAPANHPDGTIDKTKLDAIIRENRK